MKRIFAGVAVLLLAACSSDSNFPEATGKATFRTINAIPTVEELTFKIEERAIGTARYTEMTASSAWDDLSYNFNFEVFYAGNISLTRIASEFVDAVTGRDYTFMISGSAANPTITVFEDEFREFTEAETVFESKFVHASPSMGELDYYFADPGTAPAPGAQVATLSFGEISTGADFTGGDYVLTVTTAGDHTDVVYQSDSVQFASRNTLFVTLFDGDANDTAPLIARALPSVGLAVSMPDPSYPPRVEFINISTDLGATDIYEDEPLTSRLVANHDFRDVAAEVEVVTGDNSFYYTPSGDTAAVLLEGALPALSGTRYRFYAQGVAGDFGTAFLAPDRQPFETMVKLTMYHGSTNFGPLDLYIVDADESIDDNLPARASIQPGAQTLTAVLEAGSYDMYITEFNDKTVLAGPYRLDVILGDIVDLVAVDALDPAVLDLLFLSGGPAP